MIVWQTVNARLTVFVTPETVVSTDLWRNMVGEEPEESIIQRASATTIQTGPFADGTLTLQVQPERIDFAHEPIGAGANGQPATLGIFPGAVEPLLSLGNRWVQSDWFPQSIQRIALGCLLMSPTPDRATGYRELALFIDGVPKTPEVSDFSYQVNRIRESQTRVEGLRLNRLSKWSVGAFRTVTVTPSAATPTLGELHLHVRLELDINTHPESMGPILREDVEAVLGDLFEGAKEISERGNRF